MLYFPGNEFRPACFAVFAGAGIQNSTYLVSRLQAQTGRRQASSEKASGQKK
jgi:hypothetical protein